MTRRRFLRKEDQAAAFGLQAVPVGAAGDPLYFGLAGTNSLDDVQAMPFLQPSKEKFLEYDLAKMISCLGNPELKTVGLLRPGHGARFRSGHPPARAAWVIYEQLEQLFDMQDDRCRGRQLAGRSGPADAGAPRHLGEAMRYEIDQFVLAGGKLVAFIDPFAEADSRRPQRPDGADEGRQRFKPGRIAGGLGRGLRTGQVVGDLLYGCRSTARTGAHRHPVIM